MRNQQHSRLKNLLGFAHPIVLLGIVLLMTLVIVIGVVFAVNAPLTSTESQSSSQQPTSDSDIEVEESAPIIDWQVYKNEKYGFSIQYPPRLSLAESYSENEPESAYAQLYEVKFRSPEAMPEATLPDGEEARKQFENQYIFVYLQVYEDSLDLPLKQTLQRIYFTSTISQEIFTEQIESQLTLSTIGPQGALVFVGSPWETPQKTIIFTHKGKIFEFTLYGKGGTGGSYSTTAEETFDLIASSIRLH